MALMDASLRLAASWCVELPEPCCASEMAPTMLPATAGTARLASEEITSATIPREMADFSGSIMPMSRLRGPCPLEGLYLKRNLLCGIERQRTAAQRHVRRQDQELKQAGRSRADDQVRALAIVYPRRRGIGRAGAVARVRDRGLGDGEAKDGCKKPGHELGVKRNVYLRQRAADSAVW
jgi:hypothetical protein